MAPPQDELPLPPSRGATSTGTSRDCSNKSSDNGRESSPPPMRPSTGPVSHQSATSLRRADPSLLSPEDAFLPASPRRRASPFDGARGGPGNGNGSVNELRPPRRRRKEGVIRGRSRRRKPFKKLLWVKQSYPDNYTDQSTFLEKLQLNPRLQPYEFWPLVADSTVIVQHVCSVIIFIVCFVGIFQERMSPVSVVGWGSFATFLGWLLCDWWITKEAKSNPDAGIAWSRSRSGGRAYRDFGPSGTRESGPGAAAVPNPSLTSFSSLSNLPSAASSTSNLLAPHESVASHSRFSLAGHAAGTNHLSLPEHGRSVSASSFQSTTSAHNATAMPATTASRDGSVGARVVGRPDTMPEPNYPSTPLASPTGNTNGHSTRLTGLHDGRLPPRPQTTSMRFGTIKSAVLIYFTLLGLSPILKSLTRSTSSDSIWAMSFWLLAINIFFFDYSGGNTGGPSQASAASSSTTVGPATTSTTTTTANTRTTLLSGSKFPVASLSTNAAVMASTVLASRLPSTGQVFSLTLFSIEVFGLFPVFRRWARHASWCYHVALTILLVLGAGAGVGVIVGGGAGGADAARRERRENAGMAEADWAWIWAAERAAIGMLGACLIAALAMGGCSWWLIGLQKYKNEIYGPWDPARPIIMSRRHWDFDG